MIHRFSLVESTQDLVHQLAADGAPAGTVVVAEAQSGGRGTRGKQWSAAPGGLWLSYLAHPVQAAVERLSIRVGLELAETLSNDLQLPIALKWPNDLMLRDGKVGGILTEARWTGESLGWAVVGVGINVSNPVPAEVAGQVARLADADPRLTPGSIEAAVVAGIRRAVDVREAELTVEERARFAERDWLWGRVITAPVVGIAEGVDAKGRLLVGRSGAIQAVTVGPIAVDLAPGAARA